MHIRTLFLCTVLASCSSEANHIGNPLLLPISGLGTAFENATYNQRRGRVEVFVKTNHDTLLKDIKNGGGKTLTQAMALANIPQQDRATRITQLQGDLGLYTDNVGALVVALMVYGG